MVGNGDPMGIAAQIAENMFRAAKGWLAVYDPFVTEQLTDEGVESLRVRQILEFAVKAELALFESVLESLPDFASKYEPECFLGKKEAVTQMDPALVIGRESPGRSDAMDMRMKFHDLIPGVQHAEEADLGAETFGIASDFEQCFSAESEEHVVDESFVLQGKRGQAVGQCKDNVGVGGGQDFDSTRLDPALSGIGLTLGTMPIAA
jgi:hypothetical protein